MKYPLLLLFLFVQIQAYAQWTNRYPSVDGYGHHVYLEGYELPVLNPGPMDPAPSPIDDRVVFSAKGWLWIYDPSSSAATRITSTAGIDSRPNWSPNGQQIAFVRDNGSDTDIVMLDLTSGSEQVLVATDRLDMDPIFSASGEYVYYTSAKNGSFDLWKVELASLNQSPLTSTQSLERLPVPTKDESKIVFLQKQGFSYDAIMLHDTAEGNATPVVEENFASQASFSLAPNNETLVYTWPNGDDYELHLVNVNIPESKMLLTKGAGLPLAPKFNRHGDMVYYAEYNQDEISELKRISLYGGEPETVNINDWDWKSATGMLTINSLVDGNKEAVRLSIVDSKGHPVIPNRGLIHSEGQNGMVFFYSDGQVEVEAPVGEITITATHGFETKKLVQKVTITAGSNATTLELSKIWDASAAGWYSADNHFHLNYGGTNHLSPEDILLDLRGEGIDIAYPLVANLGNRFLEGHLLSYEYDGIPILQFGQEVRSHFFGHLNIIGTDNLYWPWVWGPGYDIYGKDDRVNAEPLEFAREHGAVAGYVHPVSVRDPFQESMYRRVPRGLVADAILGKVDILEIGCLWTDEIGTANLWHEFLNLGIPIAMSAGSDVMNDLYRTMAIGATRVYVKPNGPLTKESYLNALKSGKSFVSNGPQILFNVDGKGVGEIIHSDKKKVNWTLTTHSPVPFDKVQIFVNGQVVWEKKSKGLNSETFKGTLQIPEGGWVTARVSGEASDWPMMDSYVFSETSPLWFNEKGSTSHESKHAAASKLLEILKFSYQITQQQYDGHPMPKITRHFTAAENALTEIIKSAE